MAVKARAGNGYIPCASYRSEWSSPLTRMGEDNPPSTTSSGAHGDAVASLTAPRNADTTSVVIGAYEDVPYDEFPFDATGQPPTVSPDLRPHPDEGYISGSRRPDDDNDAWTTTATVTDAHLNADGQVSLPSPTSVTSVVHVSATGKGRFRVSSEGASPVPLDGLFADPTVAGRVASPLNYRDGWWTSWTSASTDLSIPIPGDLLKSTAPLHVTVEGYEPGSLRIDIRELTTGDDTLDQ